MRANVRHPGEVLACFLDEAEMSQNGLARVLGVPPRRVNEILHGKRGISADTAIALAEAFGFEEGFWMRLQDAWDLERARERRAKRPRRTAAGPRVLSLDYLAEDAPGKWREGFRDWLENHGARMNELARGTRIYDNDTDHELDCYYADPFTPPFRPRRK
jgi:addiction module HigA family antidote